MKVEMRHGLSALGSHVRHDPVAPFLESLTACDARHGRKECSRKGGVVLEVHDRDEMAARDDQHVDGRLRMNVAEGQPFFRTRHDVRRERARGDSAEETIGVGQGFAPDGGAQAA